MANSVGSVTVQVAADFAEFVSGLSKAQASAEKWAKDVKSSVEGIADGIKEKFLAIGAAVGIGLSVEKMVEFGRQAADQAEKVNNLSKALGATTQSIQLFSFAANLTGGSLDTVSTALVKLERSAVQANSGNAQMMEGFRAIGVSVTDVTGKLKPADQLFQEVTQHLAQFQDGPTKVAVAMQLMGRGAAEQIPFLDKLGSSFDALKAQAIAFGLVLSDADQKALLGFKESSNLLGQQIQGVANQIMVGMAPALAALNASLGQTLNSDKPRQWGQAMGEALNSVIGFFNNMSIGATAIFASLDQMWIRWKAGAQIAVEYVKYQWDSFVAYLKNGAIDAAATMEKLGKGALFGPIADSIDALVAKAKASGPSLGDLDKRIADIRTAMQKQIAVSQDAVTAALMDAAAVKKVGEEHDAASAKVLNYDANVKGHQKTLKAWEADLQQLSNLQATLTSGLSGPELQALDKYQKQMDLLAKSYGDAVDAGKLTAEVEQRLADLADQATAAYQKEVAALKVKFDLANQLLQKTRDETEALNYLGTAQKAVVEVDKIANEAMKTQHDLYGNLITDDKLRAQTIAAQKPVLEATLKAQLDTNAAMKQSVDDMKAWVGIFQSGFDSVGKSVADFATGSIKTWKDFGKSLIGDAKQFIAEIIAEFLKLTIIRSIMGSLFGGYSGVAGGGGMGSLGGSFASMGMSALGGGGGGGMMSLVGGNGTSAIGQSMSSGGMFSGLGNMWSSATGAYTYSPGIMTGPPSDLASGFMGPSSSLAGSSGAGFWGNGMGTYGGVAGIVGGVLAGLGEFKAAGGGLGGLAGGAAYGVGTSVLMGAATTALTSGLAAGLAAIPVVGWIALAAMGINIISGGKLFGTAGKPIGGNETETIGASGVSISAEMTMKGQKAFFGGSTYKEKNLPVDAATQQAANDFYTALVKGRDDFAKQFGVQMGDIVGGTFVTTFDKKGKATGTSDTINGVTYKGETQQQFAERLQSANYLAVLDKMGLGASKFVQGMQGDADKLFAAVQDFATTTQNISINIGNGFKFLGLQGDQTIKSVMTFVQGLQQSGETLTQTYSRLMQAQLQYNQFVAQFKPATTYVDSFEASMSQLYSGMQSSIDQANALAKASGMTSASQEDLTNIYNYTVAQMAQLTAQLQANAQSLAFSLGLTDMGSLDQVNQEIAQITGGATTALNGFAGSIQKTAQTATNAMNLLLGNLSPLNDQQKLQAALQGLRAGTSTVDQVLTIGRDLYASSQAYTDLFNQVKGMGSNSAGGHSSGGHGGSPGLSQADQAHLNQLYAQRDKLQGAQTAAQYQQLAQQIEEIANAKGETYQQVIKDMGVDQAALEKGLGIKSDQEFSDYMGRLQKQVDSAGTNTTSIVNAINSLPSQIAAIITGSQKSGSGAQGPFNITQPGLGNKPQPGVPGATSPGRTAPPPTGGGNVTPGGRTMSDGDADAVGRAVARHTGLNASIAMRGQRVAASVR